MALETGTYISDLVSTNPVSSDNISQGDDHIRLLKSTIKATFPNAAGPIGLSSAAASGAAILSVTDNTNAALRITQLGTGNALVVEDSTNPDSTPFIVDASGNVGIGTTGPGGKLDVSGADDSAMFFRNTTALFRIRPYVTSYATTQLSALNAAGSAYAPLAVGGSITTLETSGIERMRIDSSGNVGIGTTSPGNKLTVYGASGVGIAATNSTTGTGASNGVQLAVDSTTGGYLWNYSVGFLSLGTGASERMRIDSSGNVGIGAASTGSKLHVSNSGNTTARIASTDGQSPELSLFSAGVYDRRIVGGATLRFLQDSTEHMRIDASGNVGIGSTSFFDGARVEISSVGRGNNVNVMTLVAAGSGAVNQIVFRNANGAVGSIQTNVSTTTYATSSDYRLKEDIRPVANAASRLMSLSPVNFAWKADGSRVDGFIAHEVQEVIPEAVTGAKDAVDAEGNPVYQGIDQSKLVPLLTAALQEALTKIDALEARIAALEAA